jgi:hypothetical protein
MLRHDLSILRRYDAFCDSPVPGLLKEELYTSVKQNCLDVVVDQKPVD